ncbi:SCO2523 family variant P-loop protein [Actinomadura sp. WMMA1423]|uniref:SCO2523 family variant P-loop protein n=1 Tax=Actinomadura sp. WMMA1423 TaxID=2591108 RepID=UPI0011465C10|nr:SCO2523 family variant P-loop protein [Actinomadura sp. WMMA1423]
MLVIATSDKGGTGRSVTTCNVAYRRAVQGDDVCYLDFDFGSPTAGAIFGIERMAHGTKGEDGLHRYLQGKTVTPSHVDIWSESRRPPGTGPRPTGAGNLVLYPGDLGGGEFTAKPEVIERCADLLLQLQSQFSVVFIDLSAGRSHAAEMILTVTAREERISDTRWLVFHRWTRQHISAAADLVFEDRGLLEFGNLFGHDRDELRRRIRFVRTAVIDPKSDQGVLGLRAEQEAWLRQVDKGLNEQANIAGLGRTSVIATVPVDPVLQWREQLITDEDVYAEIANDGTVEAFTKLAANLDDPAAWSRI